MTTNTNIDRVALLIAAAAAMNVSTDVLHDVVDAAIDLDITDYDDASLQALHTLTNSLYRSDDDFDGLRYDLRVALGMSDDDNI